MPPLSILHTNPNVYLLQHFPLETTYLVSDPNSSLVEGDVVRIASGWRTSKNIRHVVTDIVAPFGKPVEERPPVLSEEERMAQRVRERLMKDVRAAAQGRQTSLQRLAEARRQKLEIPSLEEAMHNVRISEQEEGAGKAEKHLGQTGQAETNKARRKAAGKETRAEKDAKEQAKDATTQTI